LLVPTELPLLPHVRQQVSQRVVTSVVFAEFLATPKREIGAVIRPFPAGKVSLESQCTYTLVTPDP
jgi:hypothetical protein